MPRVITRPVIHQVTTQTVQGEVTINLNLMITVSPDGAVAVEPQAPTQVANPFTIPEFETTELLVDFGHDTAR